MKKITLITLLAATFLLVNGCRKTQEHLLEQMAPDKVKAQNINLANGAHADDAVTNFFKRTRGANAFDGAFSVPLSDKTVVWLNNDTYYNQLNWDDNTLPAIFNAHNSTLLQPANRSWDPDQTTTLTLLEKPTLFTPLNPNNWFWTTAGIEIDGNAVVYCNEITRNDGPSKFGFKTVGQQLGTLNIAARTVTYTNLPYLNGINFGIGMIRGLDGYIYGYKTKGTGFDQNIYLARFPIHDIGNWEFWDGFIYGHSATSASAIGQSPSSGVYIGWINNKVIMVTTQFNTGCDQGTAIYGCKSDKLTGPFTPQQVIYNIPDLKQGHTPFFYTPVIHHEFTGNSDFLLTYCINGYEPCVPDLTNGRFDPNSYRPRGVRVPFSVLGL